jgi:hypothetical protein
LQDYNLEKKLENKLKVFLNKEGAQISAIAPKGYADRYFKFMKEKVIIDQKEGQKQASVYHKYSAKKTN